MRVYFQSGPAFDTYRTMIRKMEEQERTKSEELGLPMDLQIASMFFENIRPLIDIEKSEKYILFPLFSLLGRVKSVKLGSWCPRISATLEMIEKLVLRFFLKPNLDEKYVEIDSSDFFYWYEMNLITCKNFLTLIQEVERQLFSLSDTFDQEALKRHLEEFDEINLHIGIIWQQARSFGVPCLGNLHSVLQSYKDLKQTLTKEKVNKALNEVKRLRKLLSEYQVEENELQEALTNGKVPQYI